MNREMNVVKLSIVLVLVTLLGLGTGCSKKSNGNPVGPGTAPYLTTSSDAVVQSYGGCLYVMERNNGVIKRFSSQSLEAGPGSYIAASTQTSTYSEGSTALVKAGDSVPRVNLRAEADYSINVGSYSNPQDIAFASATKAFVSRYAALYLLVLNPATGRLTDSISLATYVNAKTDVVPFMGKMALAGDHLLLILQRMKRDASGNYAYGDTSLILSINAVTNAIEKAIPLKYYNPQDIKVTAGKVYVSCVGSWYALDGGIEVIDSATLAYEDTLINETAFGGNIGAFALASGTKGYMSVMNSSWITDIFPFNPSSKTVAPKLSYVTDGFGGIIYDGTYVYIGERGMHSAGIVVVNPSDDAKVRGPIDLALLPVSLSLLIVP